MTFIYILMWKHWKKQTKKNKYSSFRVYFSQCALQLNAGHAITDPNRPACLYISIYLLFFGGGCSIAPIGSLVTLDPVCLASPGPWSSSSVWNKLFQVSHSFYIYLYIFKGTLCNELLQSLTKAVTTRGQYFLLTCVLFTDMWNCDTSFLSYTNFLNRLGLLLC